jgi:hypothetical protein
MPKAYWVDLFTTETWDEFRLHGADISGFSEKRWLWVQKIKARRLSALLPDRRVSLGRRAGTIGNPFRDQRERIWAKTPYPVRIKVKPIVELKPEYGVPVLEMRNELSIFRNLKNPNRWMGRFRGSPTRCPADGHRSPSSLMHTPTG